MSLIAPEKVVPTTYHGREEGALWREEAFKRIEKYRKNDMCIEVTDEKGNSISGAKVDANMTKSEFLWGNATNETLAFNWLGISGIYQKILKSEFNSTTMENSMKPANMGNKMDRINTVNFARKNNMYFRAHAILWDATDLFKTVKDINPNVRCFINEIGAGGTSTERLCNLIDELQAKGAPVEGIGLQNHTYSMVYPQNLYNQLDDLTENLKYAAITEYDYISGLSDSAEALKCESDYLRDSIILAYSHPKVTSFTMWGFGDFCHWRGNAPLYFSSYAAKPALNEWNKYVWGEWFTQEKAETGADGKATIRGHRGDYDITVTVNGRSAKTQLKLTKDGENKVKAIVSGDKIELTSSLQPNQPLPEIKFLDGLYNEEEADNEYKKLYENRAVSAVRDDGADVSFLFDNENDSICGLDKKTSVILKTDGSDKNGYVTLRTSDGTEGLFCITGRAGNGEWRPVYSGETSKGMVSVPIENDMTEVKISGLTEARSMLRYACISQKEVRK